MKIKLLLLAVGFVAFNAAAQNIQDEKVTYSYIQLPSNPFESGTEKFSVSVTQDFEERNQDSLEWYEQRLEQVRQEREAAMKLWFEEKERIDRSYYEAMAKYEKDVAAGSTTSVKPTDPVYTACPCMPDPDKPFLTDDIPVDAVSEMIKIPGFERAEGGAKITLGFQGFDKGEITHKKETTGDIKYTIQYKHPVHVKIEDKDGTVTYDKLHPSTTGFQTFTTQAFKSEYEFKLWWMDNEETFWTQRQKDVINVVVGSLNGKLANEIGYPKQSRTTEIYTAKDRDFDYTDLLEAYQSAKDGLLQLSVDRDKEAALEYLGTAISKYNQILTESDVNNKKARINHKVTAAIYCNLAECYMWMDDFSQAELFLNKAANVGVGKYKRHGNNMMPFLMDQKKRFAANQ